jgi:Lon protease-like protein
MAEQPLFPLRTVLFPDGLLELKIFEARYLDLMSRCLREQAPFGVVALRAGSEARTAAGEPVQLYEVGTLAELVEVDSAQAGILLVRCRGTHRFGVGTTRQERDGLWLAETTPIADDAVVAPLAGHGNVVKSLAEAIAALAAPVADAIATLAAQGARPFLEPHRLDDAGWVANRWCEILPLPLEAKQRLMTLEDPVARLEVVDSLMRARHQKQ